MDGQLLFATRDGKLPCGGCEKIIINDKAYVFTNDRDEVVVRCLLC